MFAVKFTLAILSIAQHGQANGYFEESSSEITPSALTERAEEVVHTVRVGIVSQTSYNDKRILLIFSRQEILSIQRN